MSGLVELASMLSNLPESQAQSIIWQAVAEMVSGRPKSSSPRRHSSPCLASDLSNRSYTPRQECFNDERRFSVMSSVSTASHCSFSSNVMSAPLWEMQAPANTYNLTGLLSILEEDEESCILTVRKIHRLGFKSARALRRHFGQFGQVDKILLLPSRPKGDDCKPRPASMGFVVFGSRNAVDAALNMSEHQIVQGWPVQVQRFLRKAEQG